jgi:high-affinity Fe2+/Pb2+ permease
MIVGHLSISDAFAYMDPSSITLVIQMLAGTLIGAGIAIKVYWQQIKMKLFKQ